jgi:predicted RNase H-like nuclease (RuvC/YqgF family)
MYKENIENLKNDNTTLKELVSRSNPENSKMNEMMSTHSVLANTINSMEKRCQTLETKLKDSQIYQTMFKSALNIQCNGCKQYILSAQFERHLMRCKSD